MSDLLNSASLVMIPSGYKEDTVYSVVPSDGSGDLSFTRASNGTRVNSAGLVEVTPWNLIEQSNTFNTTWVSAGPGATITSGQTDPNAGSNAWLLSKLGQTGRIQQTVNVGGVQTFFIYAKKNTSDYILINVFDGTTSHECWFNLSTGAVGTQNSSTGAIESVGNGWYKCSVTSTNLIASGIIQIYQSDGNGNVTGASGSIYIFNSQINIGSTAKPYFPTTDRLNVPRLTYQNGGGGCPSLLLEKQSTNEAWYSEDFSQSYWTKQGLTVTANSIVSPDGTQNADLLTLNTSLAEHNVYAPASGLPITSNAPFTFSCYVKKGTGRYFCVATYFTANGFGPYATFDLNTATLVASGASFGTYSSSKIENMGNDWYRCSVSGFGPYTSLIFAPDVRSASSLIPGVPFTGAGETMYIWGAQLEASSYPTSYIPTTSSSATRVADACFKTGISSLIGQTEGVLFAQGSIVGSDAVISNLFAALEKTSSGATMRIFKAGTSSGYSGNKIIADIFNGSAFSAQMEGPVIAAGQTVKAALAYKANDFAFAVNGVIVATDNSGTVPATDDLKINTSIYSNMDAGVHLSQTILFPTRLSNSDLIALTTI
jgi:hypothetical protein